MSEAIQLVDDAVKVLTRDRACAAVSKRAGVKADA